MDFKIGTLVTLGCVALGVVISQGILGNWWVAVVAGLLFVELNCWAASMYVSKVYGAGGRRHRRSNTKRGGN